MDKTSKELYNIYLQNGEKLRYAYYIPKNEELQTFEFLNNCDKKENFRINIVKNVLVFKRGTYIKKEGEILILKNEKNNKTEFFYLKNSYIFIENVMDENPESQIEKYSPIYIEIDESLKKYENIAKKIEERFKKEKEEKKKIQNEKKEKVVRKSYYNKYLKRYIYYIPKTKDNETNEIQEKPIKEYKKKEYVKKKEEEKDVKKINFNNKKSKKIKKKVSSFRNELETILESIEENENEEE